MSEPEATVTRRDLPAALAAIEPVDLARKVAGATRGGEVLRARLIDGLPFGRIAASLGIERDEVSRRYRSGLAQLHNQLHLGAWSGRPPAIPRIPMQDRYEEMQAKADAREGDEKLAAQVALGRQHVENSEALVADFDA